MKKAYSKIAIGAFTALLLAFCPAQTMAQTDENDADAKYATTLPAAGTKAPDFEMTTFEGGKLSLSQYKGQWVVLDFWASWCGDCRRDMPNIQRIQHQFAPSGVQFIGISMDTNKELWGKAIEKYGINYPQASELIKFHDTKIAGLYGVNWIPSMVLISPQGEVVLSTVLSERLETKLNQLFPAATPIGEAKE